MVNLTKLRSRSLFRPGLINGFLVNVLVSIVLIFSICLLGRTSLQDIAIKGSPFAPHAGERQSLPAIVIEMRDLAMQLGLNEFCLSPLFLKNEFLRQRSIEFLFPQKITDGANVVMAHQSETAFSSCRLIGSGKELRVYECH